MAKNLMTVYITAREAARLLDLEYFTFLSRCRRGFYPLKPEPIGRGYMKLYRRDEVDQVLRNEYNNKGVETTAG
jgi:hypothetical protein